MNSTRLHSLPLPVAYSTVAPCRVLAFHVQQKPSYLYQ